MGLNIRIVGYDFGQRIVTQTFAGCIGEHIDRLTNLVVVHEVMSEETVVQDYSVTRPSLCVEFGKRLRQKGINVGIHWIIVVTPQPYAEHHQYTYEECSARYPDHAPG